MTTQASQHDISTEMRAIEAEARSTVEDGGSPELQPRGYYPPYRSSILRHPTRAVPDGRRATLVSSQDGPASYRFDIRLQGEGETMFLDFHA